MAIEIGSIVDRVLGYLPRFAGKVWNDDTAQELDRILRKLWHAKSGIPGGFLGLPPNPVLVGGTASPGTREASWIAADAQLIVTPGTPVGLADTNVTGVATTGLRGDAQFKRTVRVKINGTDIDGLNRYNAIDFRDYFLGTPDVPNDEFNITIDLDALGAVLGSGGGWFNHYFFDGGP